MIFGGLLNSRSTPEPSAIPAASFGTVESSPEPTAQSSAIAWQIDAPEGTTGQMLISSDGEQEVFWVIYRQEGFPIVQAIDAATGNELWRTELDGWMGVSSVTSEMLVFAMSVESPSGDSNLLIALDRTTGVERWREPLAALPVDMVSGGDEVLMLDTNNVVTALDPISQSPRWTVDLDSYVDDSSRSPVLVYLDGRLALQDGVLAAITDRGDVVAVDSDDGAYLWKVPPHLSGPTKVQVVEGTFVVSNSDQGGNTSARSVMVEATPQAGSDPASGICQQAFRSVDIANVPEVDGTPDIVDVLSIDPGSGSLLWGASTPVRSLVWKLSEETLLGIATSPGDTEQGSDNQVAYCLIDGATGEMSERDQLQPDFSYRDAGSETTYGSVIMPDGAQWTVNVDSELARALPFVNTIPQGALKLGSMFIIAAQDGTLIGLPQYVPKWQLGDGTPTPTALEPGEVLWTTVGPAGAGTEWHEPAFGDGRVFRAFTNLVTEDYLQAVDTESGAVLWQKQIDLGTTAMEVRGDLLIVAGRGKSAMGTNTLVLALEAATGDEFWRASADQSPGAMAVTDDRILVLGTDNQLDAFDLRTGEAIYSTDLTGESRPIGAVDNFVQAMAFMQLTVVGNTVVAVLVDSSLAGVDIDTGDVHWWRLRDTLGAMSVYSVDGSLVVVDAGDVDAIIRYEASPGTATLEATPVVSQDIELAPCIDAAGSATPFAHEKGVPLPPVPKDAQDLYPDRRGWKTLSFEHAGNAWRL